MDTTSASPFDVGYDDAARPIGRDVRAESPAAVRASLAATAEARQKTGKRLIVAGFVITIVAVVLYCAACFAGGLSVAMDDILLRNAIPFARAMLAVLGLGTLVWLVGSVTYLRGAMDAEPDSDDVPVPPSS